MTKNRLYGKYELQILASIQGKYAITASATNTSQTLNRVGNTRFLSYRLFTVFCWFGAAFSEIVVHAFECNHNPQDHGL